MQVESMQVTKVLVLFKVSTDPIPNVVFTFDDLWKSFPQTFMEDVENRVEEELAHMIPWHRLAIVSQFVCDSSNDLARELEDLDLEPTDSKWVHAPAKGHNAVPSRMLNCVANLAVLFQVSNLGERHVHPNFHE